MDKFSKGILYVLAIPENANDLYALPQPVLTQLKQYIMAGFPVWMDAPAKVSLFAYDNKTFVIESFLDTPTTVKVATPGSVASLRNLRTGGAIGGKPVTTRRGRGADREEFTIEVQPHSFVALAQE